MTDKNKSPRFSRLIDDLIKEGQVDAPEELAAIFRFKSTRMIELWTMGMAYPQDVATVRRLAENSFLHDYAVMCAWLADRDPHGAGFYASMLEKLSGDTERTAEVMNLEEGPS